MQDGKNFQKFQFDFTDLTISNGPFDKRQLSLPTLSPAESNKLPILPFFDATEHSKFTIKSYS